MMLHQAESPPPAIGAGSNAMSVSVKLSLLLRKYVPGYDDDAGIIVDYEEGKTIEHIIAELSIPRDKVFTVLINRKPSKVSQRLQDGDHVTLSMILGGG
jgi:hypothetical protein